ncbi:hypothetical protein BN1708_004269, partial [Verticillium longisporum]
TERPTVVQDADDIIFQQGTGTARSSSRDFGFVASRFPTTKSLLPFSGRDPPSNPWHPSSLSLSPIDPNPANAGVTHRTQVIMSNIDDELLALAGGNDSSDEEEVMSDRDSRADSASPPPSKKGGSGAKRGARGRGDDDSDADEGEACHEPDPSLTLPSFSPPGSPKSDGSAAMDESDSEAEGSADPDDEDKYPVDGMFRSAAEKKHVMGMREVERESLLADRQAEIERQQQNRMLRQLVAKQENEEKKNKVKKRTADAADLDDEDSRKSSRQRTETSKTGAAIDSLRRARAEKNDRARAREENRRTGRDSPHRDRRHSSSRSRSRDSYDGGRRRSFSQDRHSPPRELPPATIRDFERIRVGRSRFAQYCFNPGFENAITGCYVRVSLGPDPKTGQDDYRLAKIKGIAVGKPYALNGPSGSFVTDQYVIAAHGKAEKEFAFIFCSDKPVTEREFNRYVTTLQVDGMAFPKTQVLLNKIDDINKFVERSLTSAEIDEKVARKNELRKKFDPERRDRLRWEIEEATAAGHTRRIAELQEELDDLLSNRLAFRTTLDAPKTTSTNAAQQDRLADINRERRRQNAANVGKAQLKEKHEARKKEAAIERGELTDIDLSRRIRTKTKFVHQNHQKAEDSAASGNGTPASGTPKMAAVKKESEVLPHIAKALENARKAEKKGLPMIHRPICDDDIIGEIDLELDEELDDLLSNRLAFRTTLDAPKTTSTNAAQQDRLADINRERRRQNAANVGKAQLKEKHEARKKEAAIERGEATDIDLSRRIRTKTKFVHQNHQKAEDSAASGNGTPASGTPKMAAVKKESEVLPHIAKALENARKAEKKGLPMIHRPICDDDIIGEIDLELDVDFD